MKSPFQSIRWRLLFWHSLISLILVIATCLLAYRLVAKERMERIDSSLRSFDRNFFRQVLAPDADGPDGALPTMAEIRSRLIAFGEEKSVPAEFRRLFDNDPATTYLAYWNEDGSPLFISKNAPSSISKPASGESGSNRTESRDIFREHRRGNPTGIVSLVGRDISAELSSLRRFQLLLALGGASIFIFALAGGWWIGGQTLAPIGRISRTASRIAAGNLDERIKPSGRDSELDQLAHVLNGTFERLGSALERQKRFTADASHELRTPLTIILSETQRGLKRQREPEQYREMLDHCHTAANRMKGLVESLLLLARQDLTDETHRNDGPVDISEIARSVVASLAPLAAAHESEISVELQPSKIAGNAELIAILIQNLISNALAHTPQGTTVRLENFEEDAHSIVIVHDDGPGIPPEHLGRIFDRFYRVDSARSGADGHSGLGLAIARSIALNHGGDISVESDPRQGTTFKVKLPVIQG
ncbi:ATP-binding protein [Luteolibacter algae]|uniref:histidine kinase n=1 Tax=Luteolibacter algae TaxID=454151 RepID=A0ABW5D9T1_9BACT